MCVDTLQQWRTVGVECGERIQEFERGRRMQARSGVVDGAMLGPDGEPSVEVFDVTVFGTVSAGAWAPCASAP